MRQLLSGPVLVAHSFVPEPNLTRLCPSSTTWARYVQADNGRTGSRRNVALTGAARLGQIWSKGSRQPDLPWFG